MRLRQLPIGREQGNVPDSHLARCLPAPARPSQKKGLPANGGLAEGKGPCRHAVASGQASAHAAARESGRIRLRRCVGRKAPDEDVTFRALLASWQSGWYIHGRHIAFPRYGN